MNRCRFRNPRRDSQDTLSRRSGTKDQLPLPATGYKWLRTFPKTRLHGSLVRILEQIKLRKAKALCIGGYLRWLTQTFCLWQAAGMPGKEVGEVPFLLTSTLRPIRFHAASPETSWRPPNHSSGVWTQIQKNTTCGPKSHESIEKLIPRVFELFTSRNKGGAPGGLRFDRFAAKFASNTLFRRSFQGRKMAKKGVTVRPVRPYDWGISSLLEFSN